MYFNHIPLESGYNVQEISLNMKYEGVNKSLRIRFEWREFVGKWFVTLWESMSKKCLISNFPLVSSVEYFNDLLAQFGYKDIGLFGYVVRSLDNSKEIPSLNNTDMFELGWGEWVG